MNDDNDDDDNCSKGSAAQGEEVLDITANDDNCSEGSAAQGEEVLDITAKVKAIDSAREKPKKKQIRGKSYTTAENLMVCKAWVASSCDEKKGTDKDKQVFEDEVEENYKAIKKEQEACDANQRSSNARIGMVAAPGKTRTTIVSYPYRSGSSVLQQFTKKISPDVIKWIGVLEITNDSEPKFKTGENYDLWIERMREIFYTKEGKTFDFVECWEWLKDQPKFNTWKNKQRTKQQRMTRPKGNKKAKNDEKEDKVIEKVLAKIGMDDTNGGKSNSVGISNGLDSIAGTLKDFIKMGETFMLGQMMGMDKDDVDHYSSADEKRKYASSLLRLQSAQLERQAIELEEQNRERRHKIRKCSTIDDESDD